MSKNRNGSKSNAAAARRGSHSGGGIVQGDVEGIIRSAGYAGREGMRTTDADVFRIMTRQIKA